MNSLGDDLHPNWRALATVHLPLKRFVKAGKEALANGERNPDERKYVIEGVSGAEVKTFYESLVEKKDNQSTKQKIPEYMPTIKTKRSFTTPKLKFDRKKFFRCAQENDTKSLRSFEFDGDEINTCDQFGWTALMIAACEGALEAVQVLLNLGADRDVQDKSGKTALILARQRSHSDVVELLESKTNSPSGNTAEPPTCSWGKRDAQPFHCDICKLNFTETTYAAHQTSTVHQFNLKSVLPPNKLQRFNISNKNRGLKLMIKQGWDQESGLGPSQRGRLYPVKTVMRKQRTGLGIEQPAARVTHFEAFDARAVKRHKSDYYKKKPRNRNDMQREKVRDWKRDKRLRRELS